MDSVPFQMPNRGYLDDRQIRKAIKAIRDYMRSAKLVKRERSLTKDLLDSDSDPCRLAPIFVEVVFKNIPANNKTYIHTVVLPHHWRLGLDPEDHEIALFVQHRRGDTEAQRIQFKKDRDLDIENTHSYYKNLFDEKLDKEIRPKIRKIISTKELATEYNSPKALDRLSKTYDLFLSDKLLMMNKMNPVPRRLGRRFWVREKKVPLMVKLDAPNLNERFRRTLSTEPFYVTGKSATEKIQIGLVSQPEADLIKNLKTFLFKLHGLYQDSVRFIRIKSDIGYPLPIYADLCLDCPKVMMHKERKNSSRKRKAVVDDFDLLPGNNKISVHPDGTVNVIKKVKTK